MDSHDGCPDVRPSSPSAFRSLWQETRSPDPASDWSPIYHQSLGLWESSPPLSAFLLGEIQDPQSFLLFPDRSEFGPSTLLQAGLT